MAMLEFVNQCVRMMCDCMQARWLQQAAQGNFNSEEDDEHDFVSKADKGPPGKFLLTAFTIYLMWISRHHASARISLSSI